MKLTKTGTKELYKEVKPVNLTKCQKELMKPDMGVEVPNGKYRGKTVAWIALNDKSYYSWMERENLLEKWNLLVIKKEALAVKVDNRYFISSNNEKWLELKEYNERTWPADESWYKE